MKDRTELAAGKLLEGWFDKFKQLIQKELCFNGKPAVAMLTSVQSNRLGITNNRNSENVVDDESIVSLSDQITQFCSHLFYLDKKLWTKYNPNQKILALIN